MARHDHALANAPGSEYRSDNNDAFNAFITTNSGSDVPTTTAGFMLYVDTDDGLLYMRDSGDAASVSMWHVDDSSFRPAAGTKTLPPYSTKDDTDTGIYFSASGSVDVTGNDTRLANFDVASLNTTFFTSILTQAPTAAGLTMYRTSSTVADNIQVQFNLRDSGSNQTTYGSIKTEIITNTDTLEDGLMTFSIMKAGTSTNVLFLREDGTIDAGSVPTQIINALGEVILTGIEQDSATTGQVLAWNGTEWAPTTAGSGTVSGSGTDGTIPKFDGSTTNLGDSIITELTGKIGIDTASPSYKFEVDGDNEVELFAVGAASTTNHAAIISSGTNVFGPLAFNPTGEGTLILGSSVTPGIDNYGASLSFTRIDTEVAKGAAIVAVQTTADVDQTGLAFFTHSSSATVTDLIEQVRITHEGFVGVNTTSPGRELDVVGDIEINGFVGLGVVTDETIISGVITATTSYVRVTAEADTDPIDNLDTINGGQEGDLLLLTPVTGDTITLTEAGNILVAAISVMGSSTDDSILLRRGPSKWKTVEVGH